MPKIFLSPSTQEYNLYIDYGDEEYHMNRLADALIPYLRANGIGYTRNNIAGTVADSVALSNAGNYDLHLALHTNASPEAIAGSQRGVLAFYYPGSSAGSYFADLVAGTFRLIYPYPNLVRSVANNSLYELRYTNAPAVLLEAGYHDNPEDAEWIVNNIDNMARALAIAITDYFGLPFIEPGQPRNATVATSGGNLNIRDYPSYTAAIIGKAPNGASVTIYGQTGEWYATEYAGISGFVNAQYIIFNSYLS